MTFYTKYKSMLLLTLALMSCSQKKASQAEAEKSTPKQGSFGFDVAFMQQHKNVIVLGTAASRAKVLIVNDYQARVMTSTADGGEGNSYGWINYELIKSGESKPHMNPFGGEDRFWIGPEGGQYSFYFKKGDPFDFPHWQTPPLIDTEPFNLVSTDSTSAAFRKSASLVNYNGFSFVIDIQREIRLLNATDIEEEFGISTDNLKAVAFQSTNAITNSGPEDWSQKNGLMSIWILGMFNPADGTVIAVPFTKTNNAKKVTTDYFGEIPANRIARTDSLLFLKGDGKFRGKVGIDPTVAKNIVGSYNADKHILTLVKFDLDKSGVYVNSKWEMQKAPFIGDAVNSYNDGPQADGSQLGPFYELESSSPVRALKKGETLTHHHTTLHLEGSEDSLSRVAEKTLGVSLKNITATFNK